MGSVRKPTEHDAVVEGQFAELKAVYPDLELYKKADGTWGMSGEFSFEAEYQGTVIQDSFAIVITLAGDYPRSPPKVFETGGRIPFDWHRMDDESLCLGATVAVRIAFAENPRLLGFVNDQLVPYFYSFCFNERERITPWGERPHGAKGVREFYEEYFATDNAFVILRMLSILASAKYRGHQACPCSSNKKLRNCHGPQLRHLSEIESPDGFRRDLQYILGALTPKEQASLDTVLAPSRGQS